MPDPGRPMLELVKEAAAMGEAKRRTEADAKLGPINPEPTVLLVEVIPHQVVVFQTRTAPCERCGKVGDSGNQGLAQALLTGKDIPVTCPCGQTHVMRKREVLVATEVPRLPTPGGPLIVPGRS